MKIDSALLTSFIKKACLNGHIATININFTDNEIISNVKDLSDICITVTKMSKDAFEDYKAIGEIYIKDTIKFMKYLNTFKGVIDLDRHDTEPNIIIITDDKREGRLILGDKIVCDNIIELSEVPVLETTTSCTIKKAELSRVLSDMSMVGETSVIFRKKDSVLNIETGKKGQSDYFNSNIELITASPGEATIRLGATMTNLYESINDVFVLNMKDNCPIQIEETTEFTTFYCLIAPITLD